jgi:hypothetical protein
MRCADKNFTSLGKNQLRKLVNKRRRDMRHQERGQCVISSVASAKRGRFHLLVCVTLATAGLISCEDASNANGVGDQANNFPSRPALEQSMEATSAQPPLAPEQLTRLNGDQIRTRLVDHRIMPDRHVNQISMEFSEEFLPDGSWVSRRTERTLTVERGSWRIADDEICVTPTDGPAVCRRVWIDSQGRIAIREMRPPPEAILIMVASPLRQIPSRLK